MEEDIGDKYLEGLKEMTKGIDWSLTRSPSAFASELCRDTNVPKIMLHFFHCFPKDLRRVLIFNHLCSSFK